MTLRLIFIIALIFSPLNSFADSPRRVELIPQEGKHAFPFFDTPTSVWSYNDQVPGPTIRGKKGTTISVEVLNRLKEPTSVHWHGLRIDNAMDGVPGVTQDPIQPGDRFTYRLKLTEAGTYWYHPHFNAGEQLERGLKGVLIVDESETLPWSQDLVWLMDDWRLDRDGTIFPRFNTRHDLMHDGRWGNVVTINGKLKPEYVVSPGERIRLRMINGANARIFSPVLEGLSADVIAVDGKPVSEIFPFQGFYLSPGNRIDLDIVIPPEAAGKTLQVKDAISQDPSVLASLAVTQDTPRETPMFTPPTAEKFIPASIFNDVEMIKTWDLNAIRGGRFGIGWSMNLKLWPASDNADVKIGKRYKITFVNSSTRLHPMHIHGVFFRVLERNGTPAVEPFTRDTVLVGPRETVTIGFVPEHHGIWLTHCHIQSHAEAGMMSTIRAE